MAIWNLTKQVGSGTTPAQAGDIFKLVRIRNEQETVIDEYTIPNLPYEPDTSKMHFGAVVHTADVERDELTLAERDAIDDDDDTAFNKKSGQSP